jgi:hypothetical protein
VRAVPIALFLYHYQMDLTFRSVTQEKATHPWGAAIASSWPASCRHSAKIKLRSPAASAKLSTGSYLGPEQLL